MIRWVSALEVTLVYPLGMLAIINTVYRMRNNKRNNVRRLYIRTEHLTTLHRFRSLGDCVSFFFYFDLCRYAAVQLVGMIRNAIVYPIV